MTDFWMRPKQFGPDDHKTGAAHQEWFIYTKREGEMVDTGIVMTSDRTSKEAGFVRTYSRNGKEFGEDFYSAAKDWEQDEGLKDAG